MMKILIFLVLLSLGASIEIVEENPGEEAYSITLAATVYNTQFQGELNGLKYYETVGIGASCDNFPQCYDLLCSMKSNSLDGSLITHITGYTGFPYIGNTPINKVDTFILDETTYNGYESYSYNAVNNASLMFFTKLQYWGIYISTEAVTGQQYIIHYPYQC